MAINPDESQLKSTVQQYYLSDKSPCQVFIKKAIFIFSAVTFVSK